MTENPGPEFTYPEPAGPQPSTEGAASEGAASEATEHGPVDQTDHESLPEPKRRRRRWQAWADRTPLRVKLVGALLVLLFLGLVVTGVAAWFVMRSYLVGQVDQQLERQAPQIVFGALRAIQGEPLTGFVCNNPVGPSRGFYDQYGSFYLQVSNSTGSLACAPGDGSARGKPAFPSLSASDVSALRGGPFTVGTDGSSQQWRTVGLVGPDGTVAYVATSLDDVQDATTRLLLIELVGGLAAMVLLGAIGYVVVRRSLRPLVTVEEAAHDIAAGDLSARVPDLDPHTEVGSLSRSFNTMVDQVETSFRARERSEAEARASEERMRRFVADASHELRTPLTSIRGFAELYRQGAVPDPSDVGKIMRRIEDQATRMGLLVEDLLMLARLDQQRPLDLQPVDLIAVGGEAAQDIRAMDRDRPVDVRVESGGVPPVVLADEARLRQVVANLVTNAVVHTPPGTPVTVTVSVDGGFGRLAVADHGPGLSAEDAAHVFERFYRADTSRTRASGGTGLGLSIAAALVTALNGTLTVDTAPGAGATFVVRIPLARTAPSALGTPDGTDTAVLTESPATRDTATERP